MPIASKAIAPLLWLLASESKNAVIDLSSEALAFRLHVDSVTLATGIKSLIEKGFFEEVPEMLAECYQDARPEREIETELEEEIEEISIPISNPIPISKDEEEKKFKAMPTHSERNAVAVRTHTPSLDWAHRLKARELAGEALSNASKKQWREALNEK